MIENNNIKNAREQFPSLQRKIKSKNLIFFDGPGGSQVPDNVINAVSEYYRNSNANSHGQFITATETDQVINLARKNIAAFLGADSSNTISIGQNMTTLNYALSVAMGRLFEAGDEIVITQLDHEANRGPWLSLQERGIVVRESVILPGGILDYDDFRQKINNRTKLVAVGWASNALGTVNDIELIRKITNEANAWLLIDAVHYAPHFPIDVQQVDVDFLLCSGYKFYGPHLGFLYSKPGLLDQLPTNRLRTQEQEAPYLIETGTLNHAAIAGINATFDFISSFGQGNSMADRLNSGMLAINEHEQALGRYLYHEISKLDKYSIIGPSFDDGPRAPTVSFVHTRLNPTEICKKLAEKGITAWDGHFYAIRTIEVLGLYETGGVTRIGISMYNSKEDVDYLLECLKNI
ncbi:cysteine desulfurase-like protein [Bacteroidota bacterium]